MAAALSALVVGAVVPATAGATAHARHAGLSPQAVGAPHAPRLITKHATAATACTLPDGSHESYYHCYTPQQIRQAYGVSGVANQGKGQTIVLVDAYGSPTAAHDLQHFADTFYPNRPDPNFEQIFPLGNPQYHNSCHGKGSGHSGPCAAAGWSGEATLDIEWAYAIAPKAHIVLLATPPAETLGVQGLPNLFKAISRQVDKRPAGTLFSMSFGVSEETFGGAAKQQTARFDKVFQKGLAKHDNFFASSGDTGTQGLSKKHGETVPYDHPVVGWPASSPYVVSVGGTQLQYGWTWNPSSNQPYLANGSFNPRYWKYTDGGNTQPVWNESWGQIGTGGGASTIYDRPSWQRGVQAGYGNHRLVPDTAWNAAVNGGVDVYITAYPQYNCGNSTGCWTIYGGTSAASPQTAALVAMVNGTRAEQGKQPIGFLDPILYRKGIGASTYRDVVPRHYGDAPKTFAGSEVGVAGTVNKSVGDLVDNQMWQVQVPGYPTTRGYDATTGWGTPKATKFVSALATMP